MSFSITFSKQAIKALDQINEPFFSTIKESILALAENPRPFGYKQLKGRNGFRIRIGNYRVIYEIYNEILLIEIIAIGHRKDIYD